MLRVGWIDIANTSECCGANLICCKDSDCECDGTSWAACESQNMIILSFINLFLSCIKYKKKKFFF